MGEVKVYRFGSVDEIVNKEGVPFDIERQKSSQITIFPDQAIIAKTKARTLDKTLYEAFMLQFWNELLAEYEKEHSVQVRAPALIGLEYSSDLKGLGDGTIYQTKAQGKPLATIGNAKRYVEFNGEKVRVGTAIAYLAGFLKAIKSGEQLVHRDLKTLRHLLFDEQDPTLTVVDFENSCFGNPDEEHCALEKVLLETLNHRRARLAYEGGQKAVKKLGFREEAKRKAHEAFARMLQPYVVEIDPATRTVHYTK